MGLSDEQLAIVSDVCERRHHVVVDAVAGSGKTTTILGVAEAMSDGERMLLLTYNAKLKFDTRTRVNAKGLSERLHVHSYHSAALHIYHDSACKRDEGIAALLMARSRGAVDVDGDEDEDDDDSMVQGDVDECGATLGCPSALVCRPYDIIVVDEVQDMTPLYHRLVCALMQDVCAAGVRILVLGDRRQAIYQFKGSDARFLTLAPDVFGHDAGGRWVERTLSTTYRLPEACASFVNMQILSAESTDSITLPDGGPAMRACASSSPALVSSKPRYLVCNAFGSGPYKEVKRWLGMGVLPGEIFVLAASTRNNVLVRQLENRLVKAGIMCYATTSDDAGNEVQDERVTKGKIVFATFHQAKGLERRAVLVFGFDAAYMTYHQRSPLTAQPSQSQQRHPAPNPIYVAVTRCTEHLVVVHHCDNLPLPIIRPDRLCDDCDVVVPREEQHLMARKKVGRFLDAVRGGVGGGVGANGANGADEDDDKPSASSIPNADKRPVAVTDVLRFLADDVLQRAVDMLTFIVGSPANDTACVKPQVLVTSVDGETAESVAAITGIALPAIFESHLTGGVTSILLHAARNSASLPPDHRRRIEQLVHPFRDLLRRPTSTSSSTPPPPVAASMMTVADHLYVANVYHALTTGFRCKLQQVSTYDWLDVPTVQAALKTLHRHVACGRPSTIVETVETVETVKPKRAAIKGKKKNVEEVPVGAHAAAVKRPVKRRVRRDAQFEVHLAYRAGDKADGKGLSRSLVGVADLVDRTDDPMTVWEFKCTNVAEGSDGFDAEHKLQLAMYAYMSQRLDDGDDDDDMTSPYRYKLLNILSGDVMELQYDDDAVREAIESLLAARVWTSSSSSPSSSSSSSGGGDDDAVFLNRISSRPSVVTDTPDTPVTPVTQAIDTIVSSMQRCSMFVDE